MGEQSDGRGRDDPSAIPPHAADTFSAPKSRRHWFGLAARGVWVAGGVAWAPHLRARAAGPDTPPTDGSLIVRTLRPLNLESPLEALDAWLTPNDRFFVRSHFGAPSVDPLSWGLEVSGLVARPRRWSLDELGSLPLVTVPSVLQCAGNGRGLFRPRMPGITWERGAVGHAEWSGVRLADVLERSGVRPGAAHVQFEGADVPPTPKTPAFFRSIPLERARADDVVLALTMNGQPLPALHGGPIRVVVPGWAANNWIKWLRGVVVSAGESPGFYMQTGYRMPIKPVPPGVTPRPEDLKPVTWMNVKSLITWPGAGTRVPAGEVEVRGVAWTGQGHITRVEFAVDGERPWREATLLGEPRAGSWRQFRGRWTPPGPGGHEVAVRATDSRGSIQPEVTDWNKSGYLWNGIERVRFTVV